MGGQGLQVALKRSSPLYPPLDSCDFGVPSAHCFIFLSFHLLSLPSTHKYPPFIPPIHTQCLEAKLHQLPRAKHHWPRPCSSPHVCKQSHKYWCILVILEHQTNFHSLPFHHPFAHTFPGFNPQISSSLQ